MQAQNTSEPPPQPSKPRTMAITQSSLHKQRSYYQRLRGPRSQTKQLNIHIKTLTQKYFKKCIQTNQLSQSDIQVYEKYRKMNANFQKLSQYAKDMYLQYLQSVDFVKDVLMSDRMFFCNKIVMIKFFRKIQAGVYKANQCWKQEYFINKKGSKKEGKEKKKKKSDKNMGEVSQNEEGVNNMENGMSTQNNQLQKINIEQAQKNMQCETVQKQWNKNESKLTDFTIQKDKEQSLNLIKTIQNVKKNQGNQLSVSIVNKNEISKVKQIKKIVPHAFSVPSPVQPQKNQNKQNKDAASFGFGQTKFGGGFKFSFNQKE